MLQCNKLILAKENLDRSRERECNERMQKFVKVLILSSCIFFALVKTAGAQIFVQNAVQRTQAYVGVQKGANLLDESSKGLEQKEPNLKLNLSAHVLGDIHENTLVFLPVENESFFYIRVSEGMPGLVPSSIFRPPRVV